jgi:hypothetical protein
MDESGWGLVLAGDNTPATTAGSSSSNSSACTTIVKGHGGHGKKATKMITFVCVKCGSKSKDTSGF